jgi:xylulokinase
MGASNPVDLWENRVMASLLLGIDIGTTAAKAVLVTPEGQVVSEGRSQYPTDHVAANWVEQNPEDWWRALCAATHEAMSKVTATKILGVAISSQAPTLLAVDSQGQPLRPAMIWMDRRAQAEAEELAAKFPNIAELTGNRADPFYVAAKVLWFIRNEPQLYAKTKYFLQIPGYLNFKLTRKFGIDKPHASLLQLRTADQSQWSQELITAVGVNPELFPEISEGSQLQGEVTPEASAQSGIPVGTPVFFGSVDGASAALEAGAIDPGVVAEMTGTSTVLIMPTDGTVRSSAFITMSHALPGRELQLGAMVASGASVQWLLEKILGNKDPIEKLTEAAQKVEPGSDGLLFLPYMMGERAPIWDTNARGVFFGLSLTTSPEAMLRAVLEGTAFALMHNIEVARSVGLNVDEVRSIGGGTKNRLWNQIKSDVLGVPVAILKESVGAPIGNAFIAGYGLGLYPDVRSAVTSAVTISERYQPDMKTHNHYQERYQRFRGLYENLKSEFEMSAKSATYGGSS